MVDKFGRPYIREQNEGVEGRAAVEDNVVIYLGDNKFMCNNERVDIAVNSKTNPLICANDNYKCGLQEYGGGGFKAKRWLFFYKNNVLTYDSTIPLGVSGEYIVTKPELDDPTNWNPFTE